MQQASPILLSFNLWFGLYQLNLPINYILAAKCSIHLLVTVSISMHSIGLPLKVDPNKSSSPPSLGTIALAN